MVLGFFGGIVLVIAVLAGLFFQGAVAVSQQPAVVSPPVAPGFDAMAAAEAQRDARNHAQDAWWDPAAPDHMKAEFYGQEYLAEPGAWTSIDVRSPATSRDFRYVVMFEGLDRFRARPDGEAEREFVYPNGRNLQPYQMSGPCRTLLVQPLDGAEHRVRVKYERVGNSRGVAGY